MKNILFVFYVLLISSFVYCQNPNSNEIICTEKQQITQGETFPSIVKTCTWSNFKCIRTGDADYKGRYHYSSKWYKLVNGEYINIYNAELFNENTGILLEIINKKIKDYYNELSKIQDFKDCFSLIEKDRFYNIEDLELFFDEDGLTFSFSFRLPSACLSIDGNYISFSLNELEPYLNLNELSNKANNNVFNTYHQWAWNEDGCINKWSITFENNTKQTISNITFRLVIQDKESGVIRYKKAHTVNFTIEAEETVPSPYFNLSQELCRLKNPEDLKGYYIYAEVLSFN
jgi:hypothetical protein